LALVTCAFVPALHTHTHTHTHTHAHTHTQTHTHDCLIIDIALITRFSMSSRRAAHPCECLCLQALALVTTIFTHLFIFSSWCAALAWVQRTHAPYHLIAILFACTPFWICCFSHTSSSWCTARAWVWGMHTPHLQFLSCLLAHLSQPAFFSHLFQLVCCVCPGRAPTHTHTRTHTHTHTHPHTHIHTHTHRHTHIHTSPLYIGFDPSHTRLKLRCAVFLYLFQVVCCSTCVSAGDARSAP